MDATTDPTNEPMDASAEIETGRAEGAAPASHEPAPASGDPPAAGAGAPDADAEPSEVVEPVAEPEPEATAPPEGGEGEGGPMSMMELLLQEGDYLPERHTRGDVIEGVVVAREGGQLVVNIGSKQEGIVPASDLARLPKDKADAIQVGDSVRAIVMRPEGRDNEIVVSISQALALNDWDRAKELLDSGEVQELEIVGFNKGGALVGFGLLQGFLPRSHMARGGDRGSAERMAEFVGQRVPVKIIEVNRRKRRLVMSEREAMREWRSDRKQRLMAELSVGDVRTGTVNAISDFGAFVDLGGADGLIHVSELSHDRTRHPRDVVRIGQEVEVIVLDVDRERSRIGLSLKRLQKNPWENVEQDHYIGELVDAAIANLADFGAFARLPDGLEGLIHISELADDHVDHPREAVRVGQTVTVEIIAIDPSRRRIGLSIRRVPEHLRRVVEPEQPAAAARSDEAPAEAATAEAAAPTETEAAVEAPVAADVDAAEPEDLVAEADDAAAVASDHGPEVHETTEPDDAAVEPDAGAEPHDDADDGDAPDGGEVDPASGSDVETGDVDDAR